MTAFLIRPTADGTYSNWNIGAGPSRWQALSDTDDATWITNAVGDGAAHNSSQLANLPSEAESIPDPVLANYRYKQNGGSMVIWKAGFRYSGTDDIANGSWTSDNAIRQNSVSRATAPGGGAWTPAIVNAAELVIQGDADGATAVVYEYWATGTYGVAAGNFAWLVCGLVGAMLGANLTLADVPGIAREVTKAGRGCISVIQPEDFPRVLAELKAHPFRAWSLPWH